MAIWNTVKKDIKMNSLYGDMEFKNNDMVMSSRSSEILRHTAIERYKTNLNDFSLNPYYGADIERFIGKGIDSDLISSIVASLRYSLTYDDFIDNRSLEIVPVIINQNDLKLYTYIKSGDSDIEITATYNNDGVFEID